MSASVIEALAKKRSKEHRKWNVLKHNIVDAPLPRKADSIVFSSCLHEIYSYTETDGKKFNLESVRRALANAVSSLNPGGRILGGSGLRERIPLHLHLGTGILCSRGSGTVRLLQRRGFCKSSRRIGNESHRSGLVLRKRVREAPSSPRKTRRSRNRRACSLSEHNLPDRRGEAKGQIKRCILKRSCTEGKADSLTTLSLNSAVPLIEGFVNRQPGAISRLRLPVFYSFVKCRRPHMQRPFLIVTASPSRLLNSCRVPSPR